MFRATVFVVLVGICLDEQQPSSGEKIAASIPNYVQRRSKIPEALKHLKNLKDLGIIGGKNTTIQKHPYEASISMYGSFFCAGVIVSKNYILTLADCVYGGSASDYEIRVGSSSTDKEGTTYTAKSLTYNPQYDQSTLAYDLGLIKTSKNIKFGKTVKKIGLATKDLAKGKAVVLSGWGDTSNSNAFKELTVKGVDRTTCNNAYSPYGYPVDKSMICASEKSVGPCYSDFGDPIVAKNKVYGLFSWCFNCADDSFPAVYASIPASADWIKKTIKK